MSVHAIGWAIDQVITDPLAKLLLIVLANHMNGKSGLCCPGVPTLAEECSQSVRSVQNKLKYLEGAGFIRRIPKFDGSGRRTANEFQFLWRSDYAPFGGAPGAPPGAGSVHQDGAPVCTIIRNRNLEPKEGSKLIWISQLDPRWPRLTAARGGKAPVDKRGGWTFPTAMVAAVSD